MTPMKEYRTIKVRPATYRALKVLAAKQGGTMLDLIDRLVEQEQQRDAQETTSSQQNPRS